jgi:hypothetical protein
MRRQISILAVIGSLGLTFGGQTALAGSCGTSMVQTCQAPMVYRPAPPPMVSNCGNNAVQSCQTPVVYGPAPRPQVDPVMVRSQAPMGHLRSVHFSGSPNVNITRIHSQQSGINLSDAPSSFSGGCMPHSTQYCRQGGVAAPQPVIAAPLPAPAPVDMSKYQSRTYGSTEMVPGIAHIPTSIVDRDYDRAMAVLNSGPIPARPAVNGGTVPHPTMMGRSTTTTTVYQSSGTMQPITPPRVIQSPAPMMPQPIIAAPLPAPVMTQSQQTGGYWEKASGPTMVDGMQATQVICRRQAPMPAPIMAAPQPISPPMPVNCVNAPMMGGVLAGGPRYGF